MMDTGLLLAVIGGIVILLGLILFARIQAFIAMLIASIITGLLAGMPGGEVIQTVQEGMASTLGFVAVIVGLGAIFGAILEHSGGAQSLARFLLNKFGEKRAPFALTLAGFLVAIPVFFDVGFIILVPIIYALQRKSGKSLLLYAIPLLAGLAITHAFVPPTPGPVAVSDILGAPLGQVIIFGLIAGVPTAVICGPLFGKYIAQRITIDAPPIDADDSKEIILPPALGILIIVCLPILLILLGTMATGPWAVSQFHPNLLSTLVFLGHPFTALIIANLVAWYILGIRRGFSLAQLQDISTKSLAPAGVIILLTGAGGVFKQMLINTGAGAMLAEYISGDGSQLLFLSFIVAGLVRALQGSATVAMITAAGIIAPLLPPEVSETGKALIVIAIAAGASMLSHVNDSGFWLVKQYLGLTERQAFRSWTVTTTLLGLAGFICLWVLSLFV